jgi:hypothetical protein
MRIASQLCSVQVSNEELGTGTVRVLHTLRPVAMAGAGEFDPWQGLKRCKHDMEPT